MGKTANWECDIEIAENVGIPQTFNLNIELRGNFTFTWLLAFDNVGITLLCGHYYFIVKELVRRTHLGAIPVIPLDHERFLQFNGSNMKFDPQLSYIHSREVEISLDQLPVNSLLIPYMDVTQSVVRPSIALMGGFYPNTKSNPLFGVMNVFSIEILVLILTILLISPIVPTIESVVCFVCERPKLSSCLNIWPVFNAMFMQGVFP